MKKSLVAAIVAVVGFAAVVAEAGDRGDPQTATVRLGGSGAEDAVRPPYHWAGQNYDGEHHLGPVDFSVSKQDQTVSGFYFRATFRGPPGCRTTWNWRIERATRIRNGKFHYHSEPFVNTTLDIFGELTSRRRADGTMHAVRGGRFDCDGIVQWTAFLIPRRPHQTLRSTSAPPP